MTVNYFKMGPGTLKLGTGGTMDASCQLTNCRVTPSENVDTEDDIDVLCGETVKGDETVDITYALAGTFLQDIEAAGVAAYTWANGGTWVDFEFIPNTAKARKITGQVRVVPIEIGGDAKSKPTSDFEWAARGAGGVGTAPALAAVV
jgi:hypothetical protein